MKHITREQIIELRKSLLLTQKEFAERLGVAQITVSCWEAGSKHPGLRNQRKLRDLGNTIKSDG